MKDSSLWQQGKDPYKENVKKMSKVIDIKNLFLYDMQVSRKIGSSIVLWKLSRIQIQRNVNILLSFKPER